MPPVLPTARIAQVGSAEDLLRCGIRTVKKRRLEPSSADFRSGAGRRLHLAERLNSLFTQSDGIALSSPGKLDDRFGYNCYCGIIAIDQTQLTQCIFERHCEHRDSVRPKDFLSPLGGVEKGHFRVGAKTRPSRRRKNPNEGKIKGKIRGFFCPFDKSAGLCPLSTDAPAPENRRWSRCTPSMHE